MVINEDFEMVKNDAATNIQKLFEGSICFKI